MNKIFKRTIATLLTVAAFATVGPVKYTSLFTTEANAAETAEKAKLKDLQVGKSSDGELQLYDDKKCKSKNEVDFDADETKYYVNIKSGSKVYIQPEIEDKTKYEFKIKKGSKSYDANEKIPVSSSSTSIKVEVWEKANKSNSKTYTITVLCNRDKDDDDDDDDDKYDDIYLDNLEVDGDEVNLKESKTTYTVDVKESKTSVKIVAEPDEDDYKVRLTGDSIDSFRLDDDNDYEKKVTLNKGKNEFKINIKYDGDERTYTLIINRGSSSDKEESKEDDKNNSNNNTNVAARPNQWVTVNGNLMYNDSLGNPIKNAWFIDRNTNAWYYFQADGTAKKGWFNNNGHWYYLNQYSGQMQTGWSYINGEWYCLNPQSGAMQTGWIKSDWSGDWYYCDGSGKMLRNTNVGGYRLASSGAWIR
ncbi:cell wall-binding protein [Clostridium botulinum]|uniref:cadherin-like beta sandwich domain-containing protein n=1 Tax=Clostridium botulinum TaxID=1491 RepID=UPI0013FB4759|nr:cadherin-like beta sandwich domain-containing protein [Clostridium botulinum]MBN1065991.1 cell wall-binding protein [Clostridium botulinum]MBN1075591.1 cell wall-binding protein [Clostridium botulinum]NFG28026.1 cell wall-binding protein [Clostridium botulinum]NFO13765.1 cell wall-binding protein [Clostridium botulinum]